MDLGIVDMNCIWDPVHMIWFVHMTIYYTICYFNLNWTEVHTQSTKLFPLFRVNGILYESQF